MKESTVDTPLDSGTWLTLAEAAHQLGISEKTARRRAKAGQLEARQVPTQHGPTWQVRLPNGVPTDGRVDSGGTQAATLLELVRLVGELQAKAETAAMWQGRAETLAERLALAESRLAALQAPQQAQNTTVDASGSAQTPDPSSGGSHPRRGGAPGTVGGRPPSRWRSRS
jgi:hypothetical protein